jgi:serine protease Do
MRSRIILCFIVLFLSANFAGAQSLNLEDAVVNVAGAAGKAVVSVSTERMNKARSGSRTFQFNTPFADEDNFQKFFDDFLGQVPDIDFRMKGIGSGVIIDRQGHILTNEHVINGADKITVKLPDGREFKATVKGRDLRSDLAVIKIDSHNLPVATIGDSDSIKIGEWVVAIGNPFGFAMQNPEPTVTVGVISALHRSLGDIGGRGRDYHDLIQTDAAINPGNSGGPLVNLKGEIIGINVAIFSTNGGSQGLGFAIPANNAKRILAKLIEGKKVVYGWLGVTVQDLSESMAKYFGLTEKNGALVAKVLEDSPAQKAGIKEGDVIKRIDTVPINNTKDLVNTVGKMESGRKAKLVVMRDKKEITVELIIGERPASVDEEESVSEGPSKSWRGLQVEDLSSDNVRKFKADAKEGVVIVNIEPGTPADDSGLMPGEVIVELDKKKVKTISDYKKLIENLKGDVLVKTSRGFFLVKSEE